jgi:dTDP-4-amino-4,6-dideoxygalactose transaminase
LDTNSSIPLVDLKAQLRTIKPEIDEAVQRVLAHTGFIGGKEVSDFESAFADFCDSEFAVGVASGTAALQLVLESADIGVGDEVITTPFTFFATGEAIAQSGATPVLVDIDKSTLNIDPTLIAEKINSRTKAIMPVHLYGRPAEMDAIRKIADENSLLVIEDSAQAHGASYMGQRAGSMGDAACFSFYPSKNLGAYGDAGIVVCKNAELADKVRSLSNHGRSGKYEHSDIGWGYRLDALQAAILGVKLKYINGWNEARRVAAARYDDMLSVQSNVVPIAAPMDGVEHVYHVYAVRTANRDALAVHLGEHGVQTVVHYPIPQHLQPAFSKYGWKTGDYPESESAADEVLSIPLYPEITEDQQKRVVDTVLSFRG